MPSQIKVDEIKNVAGQYKIKTNVFEGQTTAGSITVQGEGSNTTNLQQGLTKAWAGIASDASPEDSFNVSSGDDDGTGNYGLNFTSSMANTNYSSVNTVEMSHNGSSQNPRYTVTNSRTTSSVEIDSSYINSSSVFIFYDGGDVGIQVSGDLA